MCRVQKGVIQALGNGGKLSPFARGKAGYSTALGPEPYVALATKAVTGTECPFPPDAVYAIQPTGSSGVIPM